MEIRRLGEMIGAEIVNIDVNRLDEKAFSLIYQAWLDYNVIAIRAQNLSITQFVDYSRRFGNLELHPSKMTRNHEAPEVTMLGVNKFLPSGELDIKIYRRGAEGWHTDGSYEAVPFKATQLYAVAIPSKGGDTHFASCYAAYDALTPSLRQRLSGLKGLYVYGGKRKGANELLNPEDRQADPVRHSFIKLHPETGRPTLYFDPNKIISIEGYTATESSQLIAELKTYMLQPKAQYTHQWQKGDIVIWDNRCSYHKAAGDYPPEEDRIHWRVSIRQ